MRTEDALEVMKRIWGMPTFEVHGVTGGYQGPGVKSIVPREPKLKRRFAWCPVRIRKDQEAT